MLLLTLTATLLGVLLLGFWVFVLAPSRPENRAFAAFQWLAALWVANDLSFWCFAGPDASGERWARAAFLIAIALQLSFLRFVALFPRRLEIPLGQQALALSPLLVLLPVVLFGQPVRDVGISGGEFSLALTPWTLALGAYIYAVFAAGYLLVRRARRAATSVSEQDQLRLIMVAPAITGSLSTLAIVILPMFDSVALLPWVSVSIAIGSLVQAYSVQNLRLLRPETFLDPFRPFPVMAKLALAIAAFWSASTLLVLGVTRVAIGPTDDPLAWQQAIVYGLPIAALPAMGLILAARTILTKPLQRITEAAARVTQGRTDVRVDLPARGDEVAVLATAFNHMVERLERELQAQRETNQGMLRTERLAIAGSLAAGVAHEVNNPLASVSSLVQLVRERSDDPEAREMLEEAIGQIERISGVLHELLTFARPPGRALVDVELYEVLEATVRLLRYDKRVRSVELELDPDSPRPVIRGDPDRLRQVFLNLILNACDAVAEVDAPRVQVVLEATGEKAVVEVRDNGRGIPAEHRERLFEAFFTTKPSGEGTGLGLSVCRDLVREHEGKIMLESEPGQGTTVTVALPLPGAASLRESAHG